MKLSSSPAYPIVSMWSQCSTYLGTDSLSMIDVFSYGVVYRAKGAVYFNAVIGRFREEPNSVISELVYSKENRFLFKYCIKYNQKFQLKI